MADILFSEDTFRQQAEKDGITHITAGIAIERDGKILVARRVAHDFLGGVYEIPGGGIDAGETITEGAIRETKEETGLTVTKVITAFSGFDYSTDHKPHVRQVNFLVEVEPGEVVLDATEHDAYLWVDETNLDEASMTDDMKQCVQDALRIVNNSK